MIMPFPPSAKALSLTLLATVPLVTARVYQSLAELPADSGPYDFIVAGGEGIKYFGRMTLTKALCQLEMPVL